MLATSKALDTKNLVKILKDVTMNNQQETKDIKLVFIK